MRSEEINAEILQSMVRNEMVPFYATMLFDNVHPDEVVRINSLIIKRWSTSALIYIKEKAWKIYDPTGSKFLRNMKTRSKTPFELVEVEFIPEQLEPGKFYYSQKYHTGSHICPCGCGENFSIPINDGQWIITDRTQLTVEPSLSHRINCRAHYVIQKGNAILLKEGLPKSLWGVNHGFDHAQPGE